MPTGRFQSRFLSFVSQQSLRFRDKTGQAWRQMKITAAWGAQILLYPIYAAFQTTRLVSRQMGQAVQRVIPQLQSAKLSSPVPTSASHDAPFAFTSDGPIQNTLQAIDAVIQSLPATSIATQLCASESAEGAIEHRPSAALHAIAHSNPSHLSVQRLQIHGVASSIDTRSLVLVTIENRILDILTPEQQRHLQQRMVAELVTYHQQRRSLQSARSFNFLPLPADRPNAFLPIRAFYRLMAWMQTTPIAIATNLFQESHLALLHAAKTEAIAHLPTAQYSLRSADRPWLRLNQAFDGVLDRSAIPSSSASRQLSSSQASAPADPSISPSVPQPWLTWESLFQQRPTPPSTSEWDLFHPAPEDKLVTRKSSAIRNQRSTKSSGDVTPLSEDVLSPTVFTPQPSNLATADTPTTETGISTTWVDVDAEVQLVAYVKHPLEQLLDWLDRGMVWIEEKLAKTLSWLRDRLS
jgi:Spy/CpxP family protein refolding chaperone